VVIFLLLGITHGDAVFKERDFGKTIDVLCAELELKYKEQKEILDNYEKRAQQQHQMLVATMQQIDQLSLILYSQSSEFTFDMAYACQQATDLYHNSNVTHMPFNKIMTYLDAEIERYDSLIYVLKRISPAMSDEEVEKLTTPQTDETEKSTKAKKQTKAQPEEPEEPAVSSIEDMADSIMLNRQATHNVTESLDGLSPNDVKMAIPGDHDKQALYVLNDKEKGIRELCLIYAKALRNNLIRIKNKMSTDKEYYDEVKNKLESLNKYALKKYEVLQNNIFRNGGSNYFSVLASLGRTSSRIHDDMKDKYSELKRSGEQTRVKSQWRGPIIYMTSVFILFYIFIAFLLSFILLKWCLPKRVRNSQTFQSKRAIIALACGVFLFSVFITIAKSVVHHNFITMAVGISLNYSWLLLVILISLLIRLNGDQIKAGVMAYTPFMLMAFVVIVFRIVFIPNNLVNLIFPPLLLVFTIWQFFVFKNCKAKLPMSDVMFSFVSLVAMVVGCILAWIGYTLLAVQIMVWWSFQLACIQTIICIYDLARLYEEKYLVRRIKKETLMQERSKPRNKKKQHTNEEKFKANILQKAKNGDYISHTWFFDLIVKVVVPVLAVLSVLLSIRFAANMFDMNELLVKAFFYNFVDQEGLIQISLYKIVLVSALFFVFYYLNYLIHAFYKQYKLKQYAKTNPSRRPNITLANSIITILVWGSFFIFALVLFKVPKSGISLISAGLATGLGFAMKDILENFIYGLSLMSGRVRVGDYIECDGILGKVESIGYQSTQIVTLDGSIIAFLNTSLFNKNFKNMTKNHSYEYVKLPVGVAYGVDVEKVRNLLTNELNKLCSLTSPSGRPIIQKKQSFNVYFNDFGDNSVDLLVAFWVLVEERISFVYKVKETIYQTLQKNNIEIPFPQRDVYIRKIASPERPKQQELPKQQPKREKTKQPKRQENN
jgi:small-conductance mechanosensitive channel